MPVQPCFIEGASNADLDRAATPEFVSDLWRYAKANYADKGMTHHEALPNMSADLGIPERQLAYIMNKPKAVRAASEALTKLQRQRNRFLADNRRFIDNASQNDVAKVYNFMSDTVRGTLLAAHGPVIGGIHPIDFLFTPGKQLMFLKQYGRAVKAFSKAETEAMMQRMIGVKGSAQNIKYKFWVDAGLPIEPKAQIEAFHVKGWGGRAMEAGLKPLMLEYADALWKNSPFKNKIVAQDIAKQASMASGAIPKGFLGHGPLVTAFSELQLARSLNVARWMKTAIDPAQTAATYTQAALAYATKDLSPRFRRPPPTPEARQAASNRMWAAGKYLGGYIGSLIAADQLAKAIGSKARVNFYDPNKSDYFAHHVNVPGLGEYYIKTRGSMEVLQLVARVVGAMSPYGKQKYGRTPEEVAGRYTEYKMTPVLSLGKELTSGRDVFGRPVPWSKDPGTRAKPRYTKLEYAGQHLPIFAGHGVQSFYEGMRDAGVNTSDMGAIIRGIQKHPEVVLRATAESAGEFIGVNAQKVRKKPGER